MSKISCVAAVKHEVSCGFANVGGGVLNKYEKVFINGIHEEGRAEGRAEIVTNLLHEGMSPEEISRICKISLAEVEEVGKSLLVTAE